MSCEKWLNMTSKHVRSSCENRQFALRCSKWSMGEGRIYPHVLLWPPGYEMTWKALKSHEMTWIHSNEFAALLNLKSNLTIYNISNTFWESFWGKLSHAQKQSRLGGFDLMAYHSCRELEQNQRPCKSSSPFPKFLHAWGQFKSQQDYQN